MTESVGKDACQTGFEVCVCVWGGGGGELRCMKSENAIHNAPLLDAITLKK